MSGQDARGPVLVYTDFKTNRCDCRLPISTATADVIRGQQQRVRERFPNADQTKLVLLPGTNGNPNGQRTIRAATLTNVHRVWVDSIADIRLDDGTPSRSDSACRTPIDIAMPAPRRRRHPMDVLRDLMGHRSTDTTQIITA